jgi:hypothetical protein
MKNSGRRYSLHRLEQNRMHRILKISTDNAFCLHSKERVPFHVVIEVAYEPLSDISSDEEEKSFDSNPDLGDTGLLGGTPKGKLMKQVDKLKKLV